MGTTYCTPQQLADFSLSQAILDTIKPESIAAALQAASGQADSYLGRVFKLPLTKFGIELPVAVAKLAAWHLVSMRGFNPGTEQTQTLRDNFKDAMAWLKDVGEGKAKPSWPDTSDVNGFNPTLPATVLSPASGGIGIHGGAFVDEPGGTSVPVGTVGRGRLRGW